MTEDNYWDRCNATTAGQYLDSQERLIVNEFLDSYTPRLCLDIACGSGRFSLPIMEKRLCILQIDAECLPFRDKMFDCILSIQTVGYTDIQQFFFECNRILQCGGWLLFNEANRHSYKAPIHRKISLSTQFYRHSYSEICSMLIDNGFQIKKVAGMNWLPIKRDSDNRWIPLASKIESGLKLSNFPSISPWVFYLAQKSVSMTEGSRPDTEGENQW